MNQIPKWIVGGCTCLQFAWAMPTGVGLGTGWLKGDAMQGPAWVGVATAYWMPDGEMPGMSIGGIYAVSAEKNTGRRAEPSRQGARIRELCPSENGDAHMANGRVRNAGTQANRQFILKAQCAK